MNFWTKIKLWFRKNKKIIILSSVAVLVVVGTGVFYVINKDKKLSLLDWLKIATKEELEDAYEKLRLDYLKTGVKEYPMEQISQELGNRGAEEWFKNHPRNTDPNFRWTDANRWDKN
ncbi:MAG: hypothetical protein ABII85_00030 [Bacillota bacterium]